MNELEIASSGSDVVPISLSFQVAVQNSVSQSLTQAPLFHFEGVPLVTQGVPLTVTGVFQPMRESQESVIARAARSGQMRAAIASARRSE